ncbi:exodeoxyribonuclease III [Rathayibacter toxicus]|uniref:exodeoxyribonuclease III n=1 Tax=Rathayibacter toxicus TaxID=145458 RepID=UPI000CE8A32F|nr:exodeoxyribonuclease III [Rathayibacter toxicus]PPI56854.1 exodeoxyribonuclease III [Rathayibacter toxicus]QOD10521.1 exodeoxyribonuclease III [Rathayibacter toxicus]QWL27257.1 exodeoxyribonuclease III [Rathayibacter toxicus]
MRIATWNVNSIRARTGRTIDWLEREDIDVIAMQELKCKPEQFPYDAFADAGYHVEMVGYNQWNGVGIASRLPLEDVTIGFPGMPGFAKTPLTDGSFPPEARAISATINGIRIWSLYVPNGRATDDPHYRYKLEWLATLRACTRDWLAAEPDLPLALMGDWNVAPLDSDVGDPSLGPGSTHISPPEREAFAAFGDAGLQDVVRPLVPDGYTYWDYKQLRFPRNEGLRIDFVLGSPALSNLVTAAAIHREERKGDAPSDHVPVVVELAAETILDDDRPMTF